MRVNLASDRLDDFDLEYKLVSIISKLLTLDDHRLIISLTYTGEVLELADRRDLGSRAARREGSTPSFPTVISLNRITKQSYLTKDQYARMHPEMIKLKVI